MGNRCCCVNGLQAGDYGLRPQDSAEISKKWIGSPSSVTPTGGPNGGSTTTEVSWYDNDQLWVAGGAEGYTPSQMKAVDVEAQDEDEASSGKWNHWLTTRSHVVARSTCWSLVPPADTGHSDKNLPL